MIRAAILTSLLLLTACDSIAWTRMLERSYQNSRNCSCETENCTRPGAR